MTKFLIVSDTHGDRDILVDIFNHWQSNVAAVFIMAIQSYQPMTVYLTASQL
ncbi:hypothetical protein ACG92U_05185 [Leuconostoc citreum]